MTSRLQPHLAFGLIPAEAAVLCGCVSIDSQYLESQHPVSLDKVGRCHWMLSGFTSGMLSRWRKWQLWATSSCDAVHLSRSSNVILQQVTLRSGTLHIQPKSQLQQNGHISVQPACLTFNPTASQHEQQAQRQLSLKVRVLPVHSCAPCNGSAPLTVEAASRCCVLSHPGQAGGCASPAARQT